MDELREKVKQAIQTYNKCAEVYTAHTSQKLLQFQLNEFVSLLPSKGRVLDIGCGAGRDGEYLKGEGIDVLGIDIAEKLLEEAGKKILVKKQNFLTMRFKDEFDGVWCMASLSDVPKEDCAKALKKFYSALKKGGVVYVAVKEGEGEKVIEKERYGGLPRFYAFYKKDELASLLAASGFEVVKSEVSNDNGVFWVEVFARKV